MYAHHDLLFALSGTLIATGRAHTSEYSSFVVHHCEFRTG